MIVKDTTQSSIERLGQLFPNCVTETLDAQHSTPERPVYKKAVDFELLRQMLSVDAPEGGEAYAFTWVGKQAAIAEANRPTGKTLRPCPDESVDWDSTENLYLEGDNLDALKLLRESCLGAVKVIYIDPPYNTGSDFVYRDDFRLQKTEYEARPGTSGGAANGSEQNAGSSGRFHSAWCSMIYARLLLCRSLLTDDGVIFISIDDHEQANLKKICDELFGEENFLAQVVWERAFSPVNLKKHFSESHDYILCYAKNKKAAVCSGLPRNAAANGRYSNPDNDPRGPWTSGDLSVGPRVESRVYEIVTPKGRTILPPSGYCWRLDRQTFDAYVADNRIWFGDGTSVPRIKRFLSDVKQGITPMTIWKYQDVGHSQDATKQLKELFDGKAYFNYPKPVELIKRCIRLYGGPDSIVLDFFSGSATTAQAVMELNAEDHGKRRFILVQLPERLEEKSIAYRDGYRTICDIGKERIRRAGKKIRAEMRLFDPDIDVGFRVFKLEDRSDPEEP